MGVGATTGEQRQGSSISVTSRVYSSSRGNVIVPANQLLTALGSIRLSIGRFINMIVNASRRQIVASELRQL